MARGQGKKTQVSVQAKPSTQAKAPMKAQANNVIFALDIGTRSIIGMVGIVEENKVKVIAVEKEEHGERAMMDGQIENIAKVSVLAEKVKKRLESKIHIQLTRVCVAAAGRALKTKRADYELELPGTQLIDDEIISRLEAGAIAKAEEAFDAENEAQDDFRRFYLVGYTVCQYFLDQYMISNLKDHRGRQLKVDLIATFLPSEVVESLYTTMHKIGLEVASLTLEPIAAINAAIPENIRLLNLVMVDIGAGTSDIAACTGGSVTGYTMATVAGDEITETIMKQHLVDFPTAESIKIQLESKDEISFTNILGISQKLARDEIFKCVRGTLEALSKEIADKVVEINGTAPSALFLVGGGSKLAGLKDGVTEALGMDANRVTIAGNYFQSSAFSDEYELDNPEYATPLGILISSGLNLINDSFRVTLNGKPAKLFRSGSFTALNLLMMNGYNFRDIMGRAGLNLTITVNGMRKVFYGTASEPASLFINQKDGKLSDVIHAGDEIEFVPAVQGVSAKARLQDIDGAEDCIDITLNGTHVSLDTALKNGDTVMIKWPEKPSAPVLQLQTEETSGSGQASDIEEGMQEEANVQALERESTELTKVPKDKTEEQPEREAAEQNEKEQQNFQTQPKTNETILQEENEEPVKTELFAEAAEDQHPDGESEGEEVSENPEKNEQSASEMASSGNEPGQTEEEHVFFELNGATLKLPKKKDGRPYYLMDLIQYSGIDLERPKGVVLLKVNGEEGRFQQVLKEGDVISILEASKE